MRLGSPPVPAPARRPRPRGDEPKNIGFPRYARPQPSVLHWACPATVLPRPTAVAGEGGVQWSRPVNCAGSRPAAANNGANPVAGGARSPSVSTEADTRETAPAGSKRTPSCRTSHGGSVQRTERSRCGGISGAGPCDTRNSQVVAGAERRPHRGPSVGPAHRKYSAAHPASPRPGRFDVSGPVEELLRARSSGTTGGPRRRRGKQLQTGLEQQRDDRAGSRGPRHAQGRRRTLPCAPAAATISGDGVSPAASAAASGSPPGSAADTASADGGRCGRDRARGSGG